MVAYVIFIKERTHNQGDVEISFSYSKLDRKKDRQMALAP
jgi:hypothetical protein